MLELRKVPFSFADFKFTQNGALANGIHDKTNCLPAAPLPPGVVQVEVKELVISRQLFVCTLPTQEHHDTKILRDEHELSMGDNAHGGERLIIEPARLRDVVAEGYRVVVHTDRVQSHSSLLSNNICIARLVKS